MAGKFYSERNLGFLLHEVHEAETLTSMDRFSDQSREVFDLIIDTAGRVAREMLHPLFREMDQKPPRFEDGTIRVHPAIRKFLKESGEGGWIAASASYDHGGGQMPVMLRAAAAFIWGAGNFSAGAYPFLTSGAADLIETFGSDELKHAYLPSMFSGAWQGTMALTEPQAGSSLTDLATVAEPTDQGYYLMKGQKIFISAGDHDAVDNVVHLLLAKIPGGPPGVKGISLFVVPKKRPEAGGLAANDVTTAGVFHKMGYRGCPITHLVFGDAGDCRGYLVGQPHKGLSYMFQMMNEARIGVGMQAASIASAAYFAALEYARERPQGRPITAKDPTSPQVPILRHADIRRLLLFQRSVVEGSLSLLLFCCRLQDLARHGQGDEQKESALLLDLLTPIAKTFPSEMGIQSVSAGLQILGGYGYTEEFPLEQHYRDIRIHPIHEGTTGIQGMDLLGRKVVMENGRAMAVFMTRLAQEIQKAAKDPELAPYGTRLDDARKLLESVTGALVKKAMTGDVEVFLADASLYLELFGLVTIAWQWLVQGRAAKAGLAAGAGLRDQKFYQGKLTVMKYFFHYELPKALGLAARLTETESLTPNLDEGMFDD